MTNRFTRLVMGAGVEARVRNGSLELQPLSPVPGLNGPMPLIPDDPKDPYVFRVDMSVAGKGTLPVVFDAAPIPHSCH